jgi:hypothetical protein
LNQLQSSQWQNIERQLPVQTDTVHRAYAKRALMKIPALEDYEQRAPKKVESTT